MIAINDIYSSIQGEGVLTGTPMVIIRLQGCGVGCPFCDTKETWKPHEKFRVETIESALGTNPRWTMVAPPDVAVFARSLSKRIDWALITGGEPAEQSLKELVTSLHEAGFLTALETSGTANGFLGAGFDWICISPKFNMPGGKPVKPHLLELADEVKAVVSSSMDVFRLMNIAAGKSLPADCIISLQPESMDKAMTDLCVAVCKDHGWRLSLQTHRFIDAR